VTATDSFSYTITFLRLQLVYQPGLCLLRSVGIPQGCFPQQVFGSRSIAAGKLKDRRNEQSFNNVVFDGFLRQSGAVGKRRPLLRHEQTIGLNVHRQCFVICASNLPIILPGHKKPPRCAGLLLHWFQHQHPVLRRGHVRRLELVGRNAMHFAGSF